MWKSWRKTRVSRRISPLPAIVRAAVRVAPRAVCGEEIRPFFVIAEAEYFSKSIWDRQRRVGCMPARLNLSKKRLSRKTQIQNHKNQDMRLIFIPRPAPTGARNRGCRRWFRQEPGGVSRGYWIPPGSVSNFFDTLRRVGCMPARLPLAVMRMCQDWSAFSGSRVAGSTYLSSLRKVR